MLPCKGVDALDLRVSCNQSHRLATTPDGEIEMVDEIALRVAFAEYADALLRRYDVGEVLYRLADQVVAVLQIDGAGVSLGVSADQLKVVSATGEAVTRIEDAQVHTQQGPCYQAYADGRAVTCRDLEDDDRWIEYRRTALDQDFRAVAGIPMPVGEDCARIGALNLYAAAPRQWTDDDLEVAQLLANVASGYIINSRHLDEQRTLAQQLQHALDSRVVIEQAKGVLAGRHGIDVAEAFDRLRRHSRDNQTRIHDEAQQVIDGDLQL